MQKKNEKWEGEKSGVHDGYFLALVGKIQRKGTNLKGV